MSTNTTRKWALQQTDIFDFFASGRGNLVVRARAGSGKTTTIIEALSYAKAESKILLAAFNKRIQTELAGRIAAPNAEAKTLHALGFSFIRRAWSDIKVDAEVDADRARTACGGESAPDDMVFLVKKLAAMLKNCLPFGSNLGDVIEIAEDFDCVPDEEWEEDGWDVEKIAKLAILARDAATERDSAGRISFDDMIFIPLACNMVRPWFSMVVVDEAQDMNYAQLLLAQRACKRSGRIVVVGDDCQAIYGFRGADAGGLDRLKKELSARELGLKTTYRCGKKIVEVAKRLVPDFEAGASNPDGVVDFIATEQLFEQAKPGDFVLSRKNAPLMKICLTFLKKGVRCRIEGRDVGAGLTKLVLGFKAKSVPTFIERVEGWLGKQLARAEKIGKKETREAKQEEARDQAEMLTALSEGCASVQEIFTRINTLFGDSEGGLPQNTIVCSSVHRSKGLEADRVFVIADTISLRGREEKNIAYVAYTRAKNHLTMVGKAKAA